MRWHGPPFRVEHIDLNRLSRATARQVMSQITAVHRACWPEKAMEAVYAERLECDAVDNELWLVRGQDGAVVGFMHGISEDVALDGVPVLLMRSLGAALPEWRSRLGGFERDGAWPLARVALRGRLRGRLPLLFAYFNTPATYRTFLRVMPRVVPSPGVTPEPSLLRLRDAALVHLGLSRVPGREHACRGPRSAMSVQERAHWHAHPAPEVRFFVAECPGFGDGEYLAGLVPMDWIDLVQAPLRACIGIAREWVRRRRTRATSRARRSAAPEGDRA